LDTKKITLIAVLASAYAALSMLPGIPMIGTDGSTIDLVRTLEIGKGGGFGLFFTPLAAVSAFVAAMIGRDNGRRWWVAAGVEIALIACWYLFETGRAVWYLPAMHVAGLLTLLVLRTRIGEWMGSEDRRMMSVGAFICSFASTVAGHMRAFIVRSRYGGFADREARDKHRGDRVCDKPVDYRSKDVSRAVRIGARPIFF